jgi:microcystin-dependent protein
MKKTALFATLLCLAQSSLHAVVPQYINYQGKVFDSAGMPLGATGSVTAPVAAPINRKIIFRIYAAASGGSTIWTEEQTATLSLGEFSVVLGMGSQVSGIAGGLPTTPTPTTASEGLKNSVNVPLSTVFADGTDRYLEIVVDNGDGNFGASDLPINPRQQITSTGFAFHARYADEITSTANMTVNTSTGAVTAKAITATSVNVSGGGAITGTHVGDGAQLTALAGANITAGTVPSAALVAAVQQALCPPGTVVAYMGATAPAGWLLCDGKQYSRNPPYDKLYAVIGNASGSVDTNNFNVPDFRGRFLRGWTNDAGTTGVARDPDATNTNVATGGRGVSSTGGNTGNSIGSLQYDAFRSHTHTTTDRYTNWGATSASGSAGNTGATTLLTETLTSGATGGNETRPANVYVNYIIKF